MLARQQQFRPTGRLINFTSTWPLSFSGKKDDQSRGVKTVDLLQSWEQVSSTPYRTSGLAQCLLACTPRHVLTRVRRRVRRSDARPVGSQGRVRLCSVRAHTVRMRCAAGKLPLVVVEAECGCLARTGGHLHGHGQAGRYQLRIYCAPTAAALSQEPVASTSRQQSRSPGISLHPDLIRSESCESPFRQHACWRVFRESKTEKKEWVWV